MESGCLFVWEALEELGNVGNDDMCMMWHTRMYVIHLTEKDLFFFLPLLLADVHLFVRLFTYVRKWQQKMNTKTIELRGFKGEKRWLSMCLCLYVRIRTYEWWKMKKKIRFCSEQREREREREGGTERKRDIEMFVCVVCVCVVWEREREGERERERERERARERERRIETHSLTLHFFFPLSYRYSCWTAKHSPIYILFHICCFCAFFFCSLCVEKRFLPFACHHSEDFITCTEAEREPFSYFFFPLIFVIVF